MEGVVMVWMVDGDSVSFGSVNAGVVCSGGSAVIEFANSGRDGFRLTRCGLASGEYRVRGGTARGVAAFRCGLDLGDDSSNPALLRAGGEKCCWLVAICSAAPLLARLRLVLPIDATLEFVECDQRFRLFSPSLSPLSATSTATLFLRL